MMRLILKSIVALSILLFSNIIYASPLLSIKDDKASFDKSKCLEKPFKIAAFMGGFDRNLTNELIYTINALREKGLLNLKEPLSKNYEISDPQKFTSFAKSSVGGCIEFLPDGLYVGQWDQKKNKENAKIIRQRAAKGDFQLLLGFGVVAGLEFADGSLGVPVSVIGLTIGVTDSFAKEGEFSGVKGVHIQKHYKLLETEFSSFYSFFHPKKVGLVIDVDPVKQKSFGYISIKKLSEKLGFEVESCKTEFDTSDFKYNINNFSHCLIQLKDKGVDAVTFASNSLGIDHDNFFSQIKPLIDAKIPVFVRGGRSLVEQGALVSMSIADKKDVAPFNASVIEKIYKGVEPSEISQYYYAPLFMAVNLRTAYLIGWNPTFEFLTAVDYVYKTINYGESSED